MSMRGTKAGRLCAVAVVICGAVAAMLGAGVATSSASPASAEIRGTVVDPFTRAPIEGVQVCTLPEGELGSHVCDYTDSLGRFELTDLPPEPATLGLAPEPLLNYLPKIAGPLPLSAGSAIETEITLLRGAEFEGTVTEAGTGLPIEGSSGVEVCALDPDTGGRSKCVPVGDGGNYVLPGLSTGAYVISFGEDELVGGQDLHPDGYTRQYWDHVSEFDQARWELIEEGAVASGIDAELTPGAETFPPAEGSVGDEGSGEEERAEEERAEEVTGGGSNGISVFAPLPSWPGVVPPPKPPSFSPPTQPGKLICAGGYHRVTKSGKARCVKIHRKAPKHHKPKRHRHPHHAKTSHR
jgi:hypothetical protein